MIFIKYNTCINLNICISQQKDIPKSMPLFINLLILYMEHLPEDGPFDFPTKKISTNNVLIYGTIGKIDSGILIFNPGNKIANS